MDKITTQDVWLITDPVHHRTDEFVLQDEKGNVLHYLERREGMIVMTEKEFEKYIEDQKFVAYHKGYSEGEKAGKIPF